MKKEIRKLEGKDVVVKSAIQALATRLQVSKDALEKTLKATVCKDFKMQNGKYRPITNEEFVAFVVVANTYKLNPLTKEIYAYPDTKGAGIIPIVSTDGWNKLMTTHPNYKTHYYVYSEEIVETPKAKPCPAWMEIHIVKKDNSEVVVREYLDECFREVNYTSPWQTHTKRMLRHKTKIQGAREAFGFGGIYDQDEAERIVEAEIVDEKGKPDVEMPTSKKEIEGKSEKSSKFTEMLDEFKIAKDAIGEKAYYEILTKFELKHSSEVKKVSDGKIILSAMSAEADKE